MVIRLLPNQIADSWDYIKMGLKISRPALMEFDEAALRNILASMLSGNTQCWLIFKPIQLGSSNDIFGFALTNITNDFTSGQRFLNIYEFFSFKPLERGMLESGMATLIQFAKENSCHKITAYTAVSSVREMAEILGFKSCSFLVREV